VKKTAYLTIDDAPSPAMGEKVDTLHSQGIPAIWFCLGVHLESRPQLAIDAIQKGFVVGNHAYDHAHFSDLSLEACLAQIECTDKLIDALYRTAGVKRPAKVFRFPYGDKGGGTYSDSLAPYSPEGRAKKEAIQAFLRDQGHTKPPFEDVTYAYYQDTRLAEDVDWYWTYDVMEWSIHADQPMFGIDSLEKVYARMDEDEPEGGRGLNDPRSAEIVLTHDHPETTDIFALIIERLISKGLSFQPPPLS